MPKKARTVYIIGEKSFEGPSGLDLAKLKVDFENSVFSEKLYLPGYSDEFPIMGGLISGCMGGTIKKPKLPRKYLQWAAERNRLTKEYDEIKEKALAKKARGLGVKKPYTMDSLFIEFLKKEMHFRELVLDVSLSSFRNDDMY